MVPPSQEERPNFSLFGINCVFLMQSHLEEAEKERCTKELDKNRQNDANGNSVARRKALKKGEFPSPCDQGCVYEN